MNVQLDTQLMLTFFFNNTAILPTYEKSFFFPMLLILSFLFRLIGSTFFNTNSLRLNGSLHCGLMDGKIKVVSDFLCFLLFCSFLIFCFLKL
jgi:hypothetical protein